MSNFFVSNFSSEGVKELMKFIDGNNLQYVYVIIFVIAILSHIFVWFLATSKTRAEIKQMSTETLLKRSELVDKYQKLKTEYIIGSTLLQLHLRETIESIRKNDVLAVQKSREDLKDTFFNEFIPQFIHYLEHYEGELSSNRRKTRNFIDHEIFRLFKTVSNFYHTTNHHVILNKTGQAKVNISKETLIVLIDYVDGNIRLWDLVRRRKINIFLKELRIVNTSFFDLIRRYK